MRVLREAGHILLEGVPAHVDIDEVVDQDAGGGGGQRHPPPPRLVDLLAHLGPVGPHRHRARTTGCARGRSSGKSSEMLDHDYHITHTTLQGECSRCVTGPRHPAAAAPAAPKVQPLHPWPPRPFPRPCSRIGNYEPGKSIYPRRTRSFTKEFKGLQAYRLSPKW